MKMCFFSYKKKSRELNQKKERKEKENRIKITENYRLIIIPKNDIPII